MRLAAAWLFPWLLGSSLFVACATSPPPAENPVTPLSAAEALRAQAASELSCPAHLLRITALGEQTFADTRQPLYQGVEGCGLSVIYTATKTGYVLSAPKHVSPPLEPHQVDVR